MSRAAIRTRPVRSDAQNSCRCREAAGRWGRPGLAPLEIVAAAVERALEPCRLDRLHQIIDRLDLEGGDGELVERGDEDHGRRGLVLGQRAGDADAVEPGHGDVEQQQVGRERFGQSHRAVAVGRRADQVDALDLREQQLEPLGGERLVVGDQDVSGIVSHRRGPAAGSAEPR